MSIQTILRFQLGNADAIREVAQSRAALPTGIILVLLTSIARNYDQTYILEKPFLWLFGSLLFSIASATLIFGIIYFILLVRNLPKERPGIGAQYLSFLGLFWMTAPIAWLYAIPVERFLGSYQAAQANLTLLGIVAFWRVLLLSRVLSVLQQAPFWKMLLWILIPVCVEVVLLYFFGGAFAKRIMAGMGGMRNSPEEVLMIRAMSNAAGAAFWIGISVVIASGISGAIETARSSNPFPKQKPGKIPLISLLILSVFWVGISVYPQAELKLNYQVEQLMKEQKFSEAISSLSAHDEKDFAPSRTIPPKPYEREIFDDLPKVFHAMDGTEKEWVREKYFGYLDIMISHRTYFRLNQTFDTLKEDLRRLPGGNEWLARNEQKFSEFIEEHKPEPPKTDTNSVPPNANTNEAVAP